MWSQAVAKSAQLEGTVRSLQLVGVEPLYSLSAHDQVLYFVVPLSRELWESVLGKCSLLTKYILSLCNISPL
jgi:hypothetical protein